jgi:sulfoxide reductase heme-binding subunit YedZ
MTYWSGLWAVAILLLALAVTPAVTIFDWPRLGSVRRMIGLTGLFYSLAHLVIYFALRAWDFSVVAPEIVTRISLIIGVIALAGLIVLGVTSLDAAFAKLGAENWRRLQRTSYLFTGLAVLHFLLSPSIYADQYLMSGLYAWLMGWRGLNARGHGRNTKALLLLTLAATLFTAFFEAAWIWAYYGYDPSFSLRNNFDVSTEIAAAPKVLAAGILVALAAYLVRSFRPRRAGLAPSA